MELIEIKNHLLIASMISLILLAISIMVFGIRFKKIKRKSIWIGLITFFAIYLLIVGGALIEDINIQKELATFDINQDGLYSIKEQTNEQKMIFNRLVNDTGRNFSVFTGFFVAIILSLVAFFISLGTIKYLRIRKEDNNKTPYNNVQNQ